jgi:hypothetical protein
MVLLNELTEHLVKNSVFGFGDSEFSKLTAGIATGGECSVQIANLCLAVDEWDHITKLLADANTKEKLLQANGMKDTFRFVDDCVGPKVQLELLPPATDYGLEYSCTDSGFSVTFGGMRLTSSEAEGHVLKIEIFDKQEVIPFEMTRYPSWTTLLPAHCFQGCVSGLIQSVQLH